MWRTFAPRKGKCDSTFTVSFINMELSLSAEKLNHPQLALRLPLLNCSNLDHSYKNAHTRAHRGGHINSGVCCKVL